MHDMTGKKYGALPVGHHPNFEALHRRFPTIGLACARARRSNVPRFAFEYGDTGAGADVGIAHNWAAFDAIKMVAALRRHHRRCRRPI